MTCKLGIHDSFYYHLCVIQITGLQVCSHMHIETFRRITYFGGAYFRTVSLRDGLPIIFIFTSGYGNNKNCASAR